MEKYLERHKQPNLTEETENLNKQVKKKIWVSFFKTLLKDPKKSPKKGNAKECSNYRTIALISHARKVTLKILQARLQHVGSLAADSPLSPHCSHPLPPTHTNTHILAAVSTWTFHSSIPLPPAMVPSSPAADSAPVRIWGSDSTHPHSTPSAQTF